MSLENVSKAIKERDIYLDNPSFYTLAFTYACEQRKLAYARESDNFKRVFAEEYNSISNRLDKTKFQESCQVRNVLRTRRLANLLINDKGEVNLAVIPRLIGLLKQNQYSWGPNRQFDAKRQEHLLQVLTILTENKEVVRLLKSIDKPTSHRYADQIIRDTLQIPQNTAVTEAHARRAVLSAWMCLLRQNVGSCFATAPAIIIQSEQPEQFLKDVSELLNTGRLKRTFGGIEYSVPLSSSWGGGDLKKLFVLGVGPNFDKSEIWLSPGLTAAFEAVGLVDPDAAQDKKSEIVKGLIKDAIEMGDATRPYILTSAEEIIRKVLLKHLNITVKDVEEYDNRPKGMVFGGLLMHGGVAPKSGGGKGQLCETFHTQIEAAGSALKGLTDNALLKAWEFSLASFAETKSQFTRWNLYSSLGLGPEEQGGIGHCMYVAINQKLEMSNRRVQELQEEYENLFHQLKTIEARMNSVQSEKEARWIKADYQSKRNEFYTFEEMRDKVHHRAKNLANLFNYLIDKYDELFPQYFQEVYDADMHDVSVGPYDDSPAGFRLLYKHGRGNTSQWTSIHTPNEFVDALAAFFSATERILASDEDLEGLQTDISEVTTSVVSHVRTKEFLETAFHRMAMAHQTRPIKDPLEHLDKIDKKPWAYTSGGTMGTLVSCYYKLDSPPTEAARWVENPTELLVFLADTLKHIPPKMLEEYQNGKHKSMLMHSPTHAFLLKPGANCFKRAWTTDAFTYTWTRDNMIEPKKNIVENIWLDEQQMSYLVQKLAVHVPENYRHYFTKFFSHISRSMHPQDFREHILNNIQTERGLSDSGNPVLSEDEIDSLLYTHLPLFSRSSLRERVEAIYSAIPTIDEATKKRLMEVYDLAAQHYTQETVADAAFLQDVVKGILCLTLEDTSSDVDYHGLVAEAAQKLQYAMPPPIIFADTNWVKEDFCFVVNPGTGKLELWRGDYTGRYLAPMSAWQQWLDGSRKDRTWGVYTKPYEYTS